MTGKVRVNRIVAAHDIGRVINSKTLTNQLEGGIMQGLGYALMEQRIMDKPTGKMVNISWHDYKMATVKDTPQIDSIVVSDADYKITPVGAKGVGEPAMIPTPGAIGNAVYNAIGVRIKSLPITPDKVLNALYS
jgi:xanthine dehydrogenase YagR molybdenum-binding subunit